jgi:hypothetical protein
VNADGESRERRLLPIAPIGAHRRFIFFTYHQSGASRRTKKELNRRYTPKESDTMLFPVELSAAPSVSETRWTPDFSTRSLGIRCGTE